MLVDDDADMLDRMNDTQAQRREHPSRLVVAGDVNEPLYESTGRSARSTARKYHSDHNEQSSISFDATISTLPPKAAEDSWNSEMRWVS
jgi:hypothetical protein